MAQTGTGSSESLSTRSLSVVSACQNEGLIEDEKDENCSGDGDAVVMVRVSRGGWVGVLEKAETEGVLEGGRVGERAVPELGVRRLRAGVGDRQGHVGGAESATARAGLTKSSTACQKYRSVSASLLHASHRAPRLPRRCASAQALGSRERRHSTGAPGPCSDQVGGPEGWESSPHLSGNSWLQLSCPATACLV